MARLSIRTFFSHFNALHELTFTRLDWVRSCEHTASIPCTWNEGHENQLGLWKFVSCLMHSPIVDSYDAPGSLTTKLPFEDDVFDHVHIHGIARAVPENKVCLFCPLFTLAVLTFCL